MTDHLRASDAERREVSELLSRHFVDGRLDQEELDERIGAAMRAKTRGDLSGLLVDLPPLGVVATAPPLARPHPGARLRSMLVLALLLLFAAAALLGHVRAAQPVHLPRGPVLPVILHVRGPFGPPPAVLRQVSGVRLAAR
jgi:hypothetical protein